MLTMLAIAPNPRKRGG